MALPLGAMVRTMAIIVVVAVPLAAGEASTALDREVTSGVLETRLVTPQPLPAEDAAVAANRAERAPQHRPATAPASGRRAASAPLATGLPPIAKMGGGSSVVLHRSWDGAAGGPDLPGTFRVPDPNLALGRANHGKWVVEAVNGFLYLYDRDGVGPQIVSFGSIFGGLTVVDPKVVYDPYADRYALLGFVTSGQTSLLLLAVTTGTDPSGTWAVTALTAPAGVHFDLPDLGFDREAYYLSANLMTFPVGAPTIAGVTYAAIAKPAGGAFGSFSRIDRSIAANGAWAMRAVSQLGLGDDAQAAGVFVGSYPGAFAGAGPIQALKVVKLHDPLGTPTLSEADVTVADYYTPSQDAPQAGSCPPPGLDVLSDQLLTAVWRHGTLWTANNVKHPSADRTIVHWTEILTSPPAPAAWSQMVQEGVIDAGSGRYTLAPAITVTVNRDVFLVFGVSAADETPSFWGTGRSVCDPPGTMAPTALLRAGVSCYDSQEPVSGDPNRWGDYFGVTSAPNASRAFAVGQIATAPGTWQTHVQELSLSSTCDGCTCEAFVEPPDPTQTTASQP